MYSNDDEYRKKLLEYFDISEYQNDMVMKKMN